MGSERSGIALVVISFLRWHIWMGWPRAVTDGIGIHLYRKSTERIRQRPELTL